MIHSAVWDLERFVLKDGQLLHMVKLVGAIRNFRVNIKHIQINVEDGTGLVRVILWKKEKECTAQHCLIDECKSNHYTSQNRKRLVLNYLSKLKNTT